MAGVRDRAGGPADRSSQPDTPRSVSGTTLAESLHTEGRWPATAVGIASLEDKIVQQAVVGILNEIYEVDFKGFSYGFRPGAARIRRWMR